MKKFCSSALLLALMAGCGADHTSSESMADTDVDWPIHGGTHQEQRFSPLEDITVGNVHELGLAWSYEMRSDRGVEATPLVIDGVMFVTGAWSIVYALDAVTGEELWVFDPKVPKSWGQKVCCDVVNRGVAYHQGSLFLGSLDGRLIALDAVTGTVRWEKLTVDQSKPYSITGAPRVAGQLVVVGNGGADYGVRGYVSAYAVATGELAWRFYTVPGNPSDAPDNAASDDVLREIALDTWTGEWWKYGGGGTAWDALVYDPDSELLFVGVGNGSPHDRNIRSPGGGDNLFLSSIVAVKAATGEYVWHYQTTPGDSWDFTATQQITLADVEIDGHLRKVLWQAPKNGFFYMLDRMTGELLSAEPYTTVTWATRVDATSGRPVETPDARYENGTVMIAPAVFGGHNWQPMSYSPQTGLVYLPAIDTATPRSVDPLFKYQPGWWNSGNPGPAFPSDPEVIKNIKAGARSFLRAWDPVKQSSAWEVELAGPWNGGTLATAGGLVFQGTAAGQFIAYDAANGKEVWRTQTHTATLAGPIAYRVDGQQFISVAGGFGSVVFLALGILMPEAIPNQYGRVFTYRLGGEDILPIPDYTPAEFPPPPDLKVTEQQLATGRDLYGYYCWQCHGANVISSGVIPDLRRSAALQSAQAWEQVVREGILSDRGMGSFGQWMTTSDSELIRAFVAGEASRISGALK